MPDSVSVHVSMHVRCPVQITVRIHALPCVEMDAEMGALMDVQDALSNVMEDVKISPVANHAPDVVLSVDAKPHACRIVIGTVWDGDADLFVELKEQVHVNLTAG